MFHLSRATAAVIAAISLVALTALSVAASNRSNQDYPPQPGATPIFIIAPTTPPVQVVPTAAAPVRAVPPVTASRPVAAPRPRTLSAAQQVRAMRIVYLDPYVHRLLRHRAFRIASVKPWRNASHHLHGAVLHVALARSARIKGTWLRLPRRPYHATYRHVAALTVDVAFKQARVEAVLPGR